MKPATVAEMLVPPPEMMPLAGRPRPRLDPGYPAVSTDTVPSS
jgi:hypothetical protein